jgi:hypothetical protein
MDGEAFPDDSPSGLSYILDVYTRGISGRCQHDRTYLRTWVISRHSNGQIYLQKQINPGEGPIISRSAEEIGSNPYSKIVFG